MSLRPRVVIVGTSNSVMRAGYTVPLKAEFGAANYSIGSSNNCVFALRADFVARHPGAVMVTDFVVNDNLSYAVGTLNEDIVYSHFVSMLGTCSKLNIVPIVHIMPHSWARARNGVIRDRYLALAHKFNLPFFDGFAYVETLYRLYPELNAFGWTEGAHIQPPLARVIGRSLARGIRLVAASPRRRRRGGDSWSVRRIQLSNFSGESVIKRANSLISLSFAKMAPGSSFAVPGWPDGEIVGLATNMSHSNAVAEVVGETRGAFRTRTVYFGDGAPLRVAAWHFSKPIATRDKSVTLTCLSPETDPGEPICDAARRAPAPEDVSLELECLFERRPLPHQVHMGLEAPLDLVAALSEDDIREDRFAEPIEINSTTTQQAP